MVRYVARKGDGISRSDARNIPDGEFSEDVNETR